MKLAISSDLGKVSKHFGRCPEFTIIEIEKDNIKTKKTIQNPGHMTGFLPKFLKEQGVSCVIAGGAGFKAQELFEQFGIKLITGIQGDIDEVVNRFINGNLKQEKDLCNPGDGKGYGIKKEDGHE